MLVNPEGQSPIVKSTIQDIARELKITASTVSRALNGHPGISLATRLEVERMARDLNYQKNHIASSLRLGKSRIIGIIIPNAEISFFGSVIHGIERVCSERNYNVLIFQSNEEPDFEKKGVQTFLRSRVDGVLASISKETVDPEHYREIRKRGIPLVLFDRVNDNLDVPSVLVDDYRGAFKATEHLISQGCKRIAHIGGQQHVLIFNQRLRGYVDALKHNNITVDEDLMNFGRVSIDSGRECMKALLNQSDRPDGVFAVEDFTALGALQGIKDAGLSMPDDVAIIGFANETFGKYLTPSLSTVDQQATKMGEKAASMYFELSMNNDFYQHPVPKMVLEPVLIFRESSLKKQTSF